MTRYATPYGAYHIEDLPSQPQVAICHGFYVAAAHRSKGYGHALKRQQNETLQGLGYDLGICTCDAGNLRQQAVLEKAGWKHLTTFANSKTGGETQLWASATSSSNT